MPVWLWDAEQSRIAWANRACLAFSGALSMNELTRLKFQSSAPFARQLALLSKRQVEEAGSRELLRFPARGGEFILDCLCSSLEFEPGQMGVLVELVADKGMVKPVPDPVPVYKNGHLKNSEKELDLMADPVVQANLKEPPKYTPPANNLVEQVALADAQKPEPAMNGFEIEAARVDEEDMRTLREIARMINGPGGGAALGVAPANMPPGFQDGDGRPVVATRKTGTTENVEKPASQVEKEMPSADHNARAERQDGKPAPIVAGERNYFLESLPAALAIAMGGRLMRANETFLYAFGFGSESELRKAGGLATLFPQSQNGVLIEDKATAVSQQSMRQKSHSARIKTLAISRSGRQRQIPIAFRNVSTGREPVQILILHEDAFWQDDKRPKEPEMGDQEHLDEDDQKNIGQDSIDFLATVSHEVRTPLNSIIGFSELMKDERFGAVDANRFRGYAADIHASAIHALSLINDLLYITKIIAGKPDLDFAEVKIDGVIIDALNGMRTQARKKQITLQSSIEDGLPALFADKRSLKQILLNLVSNAVKFTEPGGQVSVSARPSASEGVILSVTDTGIGMHADDIGTALEPFAQIKSAQNSNQDDMSGTQKGTGLGLPLTKALVKAHHASFDIVSTPGHGTSIDIHFPADRLVH